MLSDDYLLVSTIGDRENVISHTNRMPLEILFEEGSSEAFVNAVGLSQHSLAPVSLPKVPRSAIIAYPGTTPGSQVSFVLRVAPDQTVSVNLDSTKQTGVAYFTENGEGGLFVVGEPTELIGVDEKDLTQSADGSVSFFKEPIVDPKESVGVVVANGQPVQACIAMVGSQTKE